MNRMFKKAAKYAKYLLALFVATLFAPFSVGTDDGSSTTLVSLDIGVPAAKADIPSFGGGGNDNDDC